jgi:hypothetical protein
MEERGAPQHVDQHAQTVTPMRSEPPTSWMTFRETPREHESWRSP